MRILHVINSLVSAGAEKLIVDMVVRLDTRGYENDILILNATETHLMRELRNFPGIGVIKPKRITNVYDLRHIARIAKHLNQYEIVHVHLFPALYWTAIASIFSPHGHLIYTEHSTDNKRRNRFIFKLLDRLLYRQYDELVGISASASENLKDHLGKAYSNIRTIENGIDLEQIGSAKPYAKSELGFRDEDVLLIQVSGFIPPKDQKTVIRALTHLGEHIKLMLVGDGPERASCEDLVQALGLDDRVHFLGIRNDVPRLLKTAQVVILSSLYEGLSLSSIEGMYSGRPFIAANVPGLKEVVTGGGILFEAENDRELAGLVNNLLTDKEFYNRTLESGRIQAGKYEINNMVDAYVDLYRSNQASGAKQVRANS